VQASTSPSRPVNIRVRLMAHLVVLLGGVVFMVAHLMLLNRSAMARVPRSESDPMGVKRSAQSLGKPMTRTFEFIANSGDGVFVHRKLMRLAEPTR